jgi:LysR family transcriptional regulator, glycine cleavage system transcriptional activator
MTFRGHGFVTLRSKADAPKVIQFREWLFAELAETKSWWEEFLSSDPCISSLTGE